MSLEGRLYIRWNMLLPSGLSNRVRECSLLFVGDTGGLRLMLLVLPSSFWSSAARDGSCKMARAKPGSGEEQTEESARREGRLLTGVFSSVSISFCCCPTDRRPNRSLSTRLGEAWDLGLAKDGSGSEQTDGSAKEFCRRDLSRSVSSFFCGLSCEFRLPCCILMGSGEQGSEECVRSKT